MKNYKGLELEIRAEVCNAIAVRVRKHLDTVVNDIFCEIQKELNISNGDIMPGTAMEIDSLTDDLAKLISETIYEEMR